MATKKDNIRTARFDTRLSLEQKHYFEKAAKLGGYRNLTDFVVMTLQEKAKQIIQEHNQVLASEMDSEVFFDALLNPQAPNENLVNAAKDYKKLLK